MGRVVLSFEEHLEHLQVVFERLRAANLKLKIGKCVFLQEQVKYLGHTISRQGIEGSALSGTN